MSRYHKVKSSATNEEWRHAVPTSQPKPPTVAQASQPPEAQDARSIVENLQSALVIDGGRATAGVPWSVLLGNLLQWIETGQRKAFQRGEKSMAEKAAKLVDWRWGEPEQLNETGDVLKELAADIRSLAGAATTPSTQDCGQPERDKELLKMLDPEIIFYGPHVCGCGETICRVSAAQGGMAFDYPEEPIYPNTNWVQHVCKSRTQPTSSEASATVEATGERGDSCRPSKVGVSSFGAAPLDPFEALQASRIKTPTVPIESIVPPDAVAPTREEVLGLGFEDWWVSVLTKKYSHATDFLSMQQIAREAWEAALAANPTQPQRICTCEEIHEEHGATESHFVSTKDCPVHSKRAAIPTLRVQP